MSYAKKINLKKPLANKLAKLIKNSGGDIIFSDVISLTPEYMSEATFRLRFRDLKHSLGYAPRTHYDINRPCHKIDTLNFDYALGGIFKVRQKAKQQNFEVTGNLVKILREYPRYYLVEDLDNNLSTCISKIALKLGEVELIEKL